jgi:NAD(P)-dependent dehydrogenase (short-subunit alcohol dehydrogenase family)
LADLDGQVAIVVGGGGAIGRVIAERLVLGGAQVAVVGRSPETLDEAVAAIVAAGGSALAIPADAADEIALATALATAERELGAPTLLVNAVGGARPIARTWEADADEWWRAIELNLRTAFLCSHAVLPGFVERRAGRLIHLTSNAGVFRWPYASAYSVAKAGVIKLVENLGVETRRSRVSVFSIDPGLLRVGMTETLLNAPVAPESPVGIVGAWFRQQLESGREVGPERGAELVAVIASGAADALSGRHWSVYDGDIESLIARAKEIQRDDLYTLRLRERT